MAITETRALPAQFIEDLGKDYGKQLTAATAASQALPTSTYAPQVAGQTALQQQATTLAGQGVGSYSPYLTSAGTAGTAAGQALTGAGTLLGTAGTELTGAGTALGTAQSTLGGISPYISAAGTGLGTAGTTLGGTQNYLTAAQGLTGTGAGAAGTAGSIASYMSPYQSQVIDASLANYDTQAAAQRSAVTQQAGLGTVGNLDSGRFGVQLGAFDAQSQRDRALMEAGLLQQGYGQAAGARQQDYSNQLGLAQGQSGFAGQQAQFAGQQLGLGQAQLGLGQAQAGMAGQQAGMAGQRASLGQQQAGLASGQLGLGQFQQGLGGAAQAYGAQDISTIGQVGSADQAQAQAGLDATREANRMAAYEPLERLGIYGQGVTGLMGGYPAQYQFTSQPNQSPLATALGVGSTLGGIYGNIKGNNLSNLIKSDARLKTDIKNIGKSSLGVNIYSFKYINNEKTYQGVMAQEVPWASIVGNDGYLKVDYSKVDVEFKKLN